jgi:hypothetical protein
MLIELNTNSLLYEIKNGVQNVNKNEQFSKFLQVHIN